MSEEEVKTESKKSEAEAVKPASKKFELPADARPVAPSIMSAPAQKKKYQLLIILIVAVIASVALNIFLAILLATRAEKISLLESELESEKAYVLELKTEINSLAN